jgi:hypothetical protein
MINEYIKEECGGNGSAEVFYYKGLQSLSGGNM